MTDKSNIPNSQTHVSKALKDVTGLFFRVNDKRVCFGNHVYLQCGLPWSQVRTLSHDFSELKEIKHGDAQSLPLYKCQLCSCQCDYPLVLRSVEFQTEKELFIRAQNTCPHLLLKIKRFMETNSRYIRVVYLEELLYYKTSGSEIFISKIMQAITNFVTSLPSLKRLELMAPAKESLEGLFGKSFTIAELAVRNMGIECLYVLQQYVSSSTCELKLLDVSLNREDEEDSSTDDEEYSIESVIITREKLTPKIGESRFKMLAEFLLNIENLRNIYVVDTTYQKAPFFEMNNRVMTFNEQPCEDCNLDNKHGEAILSLTSSFRQAAFSRFGFFCCDDDHEYRTAPVLLPNDKYLLYYSECEPAVEPNLTRNRPGRGVFSSAGELIREAREKGPKMISSRLFFNLHDLRVVLKPQDDALASEFPLPRVDVFDISCLIGTKTDEKQLPLYLVEMIKEIQTLSISNTSPLSYCARYIPVLNEIFKIASNIRIFEISSSLISLLAGSSRLRTILKHGKNVRVLHVRVSRGCSEALVKHFCTIVGDVQFALPKLHHLCIHPEFGYGEVHDENIEMSQLQDALQYLQKLQKESLHRPFTIPQELFRSWLQILDPRLS